MSLFRDRFCPLTHKNQHFDVSRSSTLQKEFHQLYRICIIETSVLFFEFCFGFQRTIVFDFLDSIPLPTEHVVFFDNFFTSHDLLFQLKHKGFRAIGKLDISHLFYSKLRSLLWCKRQSVGLTNRCPWVRTPVRRQIVFLNLLTTLRKY